MRIDAQIDERTMRELYLPMFEAAVKKAKVASVMCAYNRVNGPFACESKVLLEDILRGDWGFDGLTIADYNAAHDANEGLVNGLDFEPWPGVVYGTTSVNAALATGPATMADVDRHVLRYLRTLFAYSAFDRAGLRAQRGRDRPGGERRQVPPRRRAGDRAPEERRPAPAEAQEARLDRGDRPGRRRVPDRRRLLGDQAVLVHESARGHHRAWPARA